MAEPLSRHSEAERLRGLAQQQLVRIQELEGALEAVRDTAHDDERAQIVDEVLRRD